jgi:hypothetical protein
VDALDAGVAGGGISFISGLCGLIIGYEGWCFPVLQSVWISVHPSSQHRQKSVGGRSGSAKKDAGTGDLTECFDILCRFSDGLNIHRTPAMRAR